MNDLRHALRVASMNPRLDFGPGGVAAMAAVHAVEPERSVVGDLSVAGADLRDGTSLSVAGEEDPGAALDLSATSAEGSETWCPWPRARSA